MLLIVSFFPLKFIEITLPSETLVFYEKNFEVEWVHSVEKEKWIETYVVKGNKLILTTTTFKTYGAGVPSDGLVEDRGDGFVHMTINREMDDILLVVSNLVKMTVLFGNKEIPLYELVDDYEEVQIESKWLPWWNILKEEKKR